MKVRLFDTTLRDGTQGEGLSLSVEDKLRIAQISVVAALQLKMGHDCVAEDRLPRLTGLSRAVAETANVRPDPQAPYVGASAFAQKGGVHGGEDASADRGRARGSKLEHDRRLAQHHRSELRGPGRQLRAAPAPHAGRAGLE